MRLKFALFLLFAVFFASPAAFAEGYDDCMIDCIDLASTRGCHEVCEHAGGGITKRKQLSWRDEFDKRCRSGCVRKGGAGQTCDAICAAIESGDRGACMNHCIVGGGGRAYGCQRACDRADLFDGVFIEIPRGHSPDIPVPPAWFVSHCVSGCIRNGGEQPICNAMCEAAGIGDRGACMNHCVSGGENESCQPICDRARFFTDVSD